MSARASKARQPEAATTRGTWGGRRPGAGRKPKGDEPQVDHRPRAAVAPSHPVLVTVKVRPGLPRLRHHREFAALCAALAAGAGGPAAGRGTTFRLCHFALSGEQLHLLVEARNRRVLCRGVQGLLVRVARALNRLWRRRGKVFADRYDDQALTTPAATHAAMHQLLRRPPDPGAEGGGNEPGAVDPFTSAPWSGAEPAPAVADVPCPVLPARTWLLRVGWRRHGRLAAPAKARR
ncbi:MAG: hypothetical protein IPK26_29600 [Planctomycetes bacterium]|nr:hypothetical protein [Planctomycetota bacterium]